LWVFTRGELFFFKFVIGSVGFFVFMMIWIQPVIIEPIYKTITYVIRIIGDISGVIKVYPEDNMIFINRSRGLISVLIDYESSGVIEIMAFTAMLWFFSVYKFGEKIIVNLLGIIWIFVANILRLVGICLIIYYFGNDSYFLAHNIIGRCIFYGLSVIMYFNVFTRSQIIRQKVGNFNYGDNVK
jgi:exosortase family protein XrtG